ncbi:MAG: sugar transporter [candidate division Zixibacteria bacterium]|nr:sugar transporter [candidate division Zixibacteria bacterium]
MVRWMSYETKGLHRNDLFFLTYLTLLLSLIGCTGLTAGTPVVSTIPTEPGEASRRKIKKEYYIQAGDILDVKFYYHPKLNETVVIRPDGRISLQLIGEVPAAELTPSELNKIIKKKYTRYLKDPEVVVIVKGFGGQQVYVGGEVMRPGVVPLVGNTTALQAILNVGGFRETAYPGSVIIISKGPKAKPIVQKLDLLSVVSGKAPGNDVLLKPFDVVYVPKTFIAKANKFVEQYITKMIPGTLSAGFSYTIFEEKDKSSLSLP